MNNKGASLKVMLTNELMSLCRDCFKVSKNNLRCQNCNSPRIVVHKELFRLKIAHIDCDAFYASVEKSDNPHIRNFPVIVGGGYRGVVTTCCYIARIYGVRSAMPMFKAIKLCPNAIIISPRMQRYREISSYIKNRLITLSPAIEFVSLDEAYIDLTGTQRLHGRPAAVMLARIANDIEHMFGITISIGLSYNKFLAKIGSELEKPRGFSIIGKSDAKELLKEKSVSKILGVGEKTKLYLASKGIKVIGDILKYEKDYLKHNLGSFGETLWFLAQGIDNRKIIPNRPTKSISCEKTFQINETDFTIIRSYLWDLVEKISSQLKRKNLLTTRLSLKLKTENFRLIQRSRTLQHPTNLAESIFQESVVLLEENLAQGPFRLVGLSLTQLSNSEAINCTTNLFQDEDSRITSAEEAIDFIRNKFGEDSIIKGRSLRKF